MHVAVLTASHELIEAATDPYFYSQPAWKGFVQGSGSIVPSVRIERGDDELSDYCGNFSAPLDYPFAVSNAYSNRRARAGKDPCKLDAPIAVTALPRPGSADDGVDFSSGSAHLILDLYTSDRKSTYVIPQAWAAVRVDAVSARTFAFSVHSAPSAEAETLEIDLTSLTNGFVREIAEDDSTPLDMVQLTLCDTDNDPCVMQLLPIAVPPPLKPGLATPSGLPRDAGVESDGAAHAE